MTRAEALAILASGDFDRFIGTREGLEVEFKSEPYRVEQDDQKFELAKDVSAFANALGGVIVIGVRTRREDVAAVDIVAHARLVERGLIDEQRYEGAISDRVYPRLEGLHVRFCPSGGDVERGLVAIDVPPQQDVDRYFLVQRPIFQGDERTPGWLVGIAVRSVGRVEVRRIGEIHTLINRGLSVGGQLADLAEGIAELRDHIAGGSAAPQETPADRLDAVIAARLDGIGL